MISVIIPARNSEKTIKSSILSVLNQGIDDLEIICILNGCTDNTESEVLSLKDPRIRIAYSSEGIVPALNEGLRISKGEFIARQDADDFWFENKLKKQLNFLDINKEIDILGTQMSVVDGSYRHIRNTNYPLTHKEIANHLLNSENPIGHPSVIFRRRVLDKCAGYFDLFPFAEDMDLWARSIPWFKFANLSDILVRYTHVPNSSYNPRVPSTLSSWYRIIYGI